MEEIWKTIKEHPKYMVSNKGRIKSMSYNNTGEPKVMTPCVDRKGYLFVCLNGKQKRVHRLVASAFLPSVAGCTLINHKDENKANNEVGNLEWCNSHYNLYYNGNRVHVDDAHKKCVAQFDDGVLVRKFNSITDASLSQGVTIQAISRCLRGISKTCCGYEWRYI